MKTRDVTVVRIYFREAESLLDKLLTMLRDREHVRGVTVFRGIAGFGRSGKMHLATMMDLSVDLPLVVEYFDEPGQVAHTLDHVSELVEPGHILTWPAQIVVED